MPNTPQQSDPASPPTLPAEALRERIKELQCLYEVAAAFAEHPRSLSDAFSRIGRALQTALRFPARAEASVRLDRLEVRTEPHEGFGEQLSSDIVVASEVRGAISVGYRRASRHDAASGVEPGFLPEERELVHAVARQVGVFVQSVEAQEHTARIEEQLRHADRLASIGQLAAGVAHEINEPLGNILGFAQLAQKAQGVPDTVRQDLDKIVRATMHGREIIRKLLVFARQAPASKALISLNVVVDDALFLLEAGCENPGIRFQRSLDPALPSIEADPVQMRQTVVNLVINAIHAIEDSGTISVETRAANGAVELVVEDTGKGMGPEVAAKAFDPFFTTKDVGEGTGLGLSVVQGIVAGHGGTIDVETEPGRGSRFTVRLPLASTA